MYFLVRREGLDGFRVLYNVIDDFVRAGRKIDYVKAGSLTGLEFGEITPDPTGNWLNQSNSDFERLIPLADRQTKLAKSVEEERAVFGLYSLGVITARDEWVYDFDALCLGSKVRSFINEYEENRARYGGR